MEFDKRYAAAGLAVVLIILIGIAIMPSAPEDGTYPTGVEIVEEHGALTLYRDSIEGEVIPALGTMSASDDLVVKWEADVSTSDIDAWLYAVSGVEIEKAVHTQDGTVHIFTLTLEGVPEGRTECYVGFGGQYTPDKPWVGSTEHVFIEQSSVPSYPAPEFVETPNASIAVVGESVEFTWGVIYTGPCISRFTINGVTLSSVTMIPTSSAQTLTFYHAFNEAGEHKAKLILEPEYDIAYADEVTITVEVPTNDTTPTGSTDIGTTNTTTGSPDGEFAWGVEIIISAVLIVVVIFIVILRECIKED